MIVGCGLGFCFEFLFVVVGCVGFCFFGWLSFCSVCLGVCLI